MCVTCVLAWVPSVPSCVGERSCTYIVTHNPSFPAWLLGQTKSWIPDPRPGLTKCSVQFRIFKEYLKYNASMFSLRKRWPWKIRPYIPFKQILIRNTQSADPSFSYHITENQHFSKCCPSRPINNDLGLHVLVVVEICTMPIRPNSC